MRIGIVLFNLGGPDSLDAVRPFLKNLFNDPAIIGAPGPVRKALGAFISWRRADVARAIYQKMGGRSPILPQTQAQRDALGEILAAASPDDVFKIVISMRYWHPFSKEAATELADFGPDRIVLLPLYPQFSTTTSGSSFGDWERSAKEAGLDVPTTRICCYYDQPKVIGAMAELIRPALEAARLKLGDGKGIRLLLSAHGLPEKIIAKGDPYQWQVERTAAAIGGVLDAQGWGPASGVEPVVCYQSRVGPLKWIGPSTDDEIRRAGQDGKGVVVVPVAFVSEHSETLVELDIEYRELASQAGIAVYERVSTVGTHPEFIGALSDMVRATGGAAPGGGPSATRCEAVSRGPCPEFLGRCPCRN